MATKTSPVQINQAMLDANGDTAKAAAFLDVDENTLKRRIAEEPALKAHWRGGQVEPPGPETRINRPPDLQLPGLEAFNREEATLALGIANSRLNLPVRAQNLAMGCQAMQRSNYGPLIDMMGGGVVKAFLGALMDLEDNEERLKKLDELPEEQRLAWFCAINQANAGLREFIHKAKQEANQAILVKAKVAALSGGQRGPNMAGKPAFSHLRKADAPPVDV